MMARRGRMFVILRRAVVLGAAAAVVAAASLYAFLRIDPVGYRAFVFQPVREVTFFVQELDALSRWDDIETVRIPEPETIRIPAAGPNSVEIVAGLYRPTGRTPAATVILQHGSYPWGRKAGLMRLLAARFSAEGWLVVAPDARGFGDSADPPDVEDPEAWRTAADLSRLIDYLQAAGDIQSSNVFVLGHSMGANHSLEGGLPDPRVKALILIGPGRYPNGEDLAVPDWERARFSADRGLDTSISPEVARFAYSLGNIRLLAEAELASPSHKPILLIDGDQESAAALTYLRSVVEKVAGPLEYHTLSGAGHYCGVGSFYGSELVYYRPDLFDPFYEILTDFLTAQISVRAAPALDARSELVTPVAE